MAFIGLSAIAIAHADDTSGFAPFSINNNGVMAGEGNGNGGAMIYNNGIVYTGPVGQSLWDINNAAVPMAVGNSTSSALFVPGGGLCLVYQLSDNTWHNSPLSLPSSWGLTYSTLSRINDRYEIVGHFQSEDGMHYASYIRNGLPISLDTKVSGWTGVNALSINNNGVIVGTATKSTDQSYHAVMLLPFEFISAPSDTNQAPQVLSNIPAIDESFFESLIDNNGTSTESGPAPIEGNDASTDPTTAQVTLSGPLSTTTTNSLSLSLTLLSNGTTVSDTLTETAVNSRVFQNSAGNLQVSLLAPIDLSTFILNAQISNTTWGTSVVQDLVAVSSSSYVYDTKAITTSVTFTGPLSPTTVDTISVLLVNPSNPTQSRTVSLTETGANTQVFQGGGVTVTFTLYNGFTAAQDSVILTVNDPTYGISNQPTVVWEEGENSLVFDSTGAAIDLGDGNPLGTITTGQPFTPPAIPDSYKFKIRMAKGLANGATTTLTLQGLDSSGNQLQSVNVEMDQDPNNSNQYISAKTLVAVDGGVVSTAVQNAYPTYLFFDPPHFKVMQPEGTGTPILLSDKTTTYVFPAVRWQLSGGSYSNLTDAYKPGSGSSLGTVHPEPSTGAVAFEHDTNVELFAIVREYDASQQKSRYFCGAADRPATITVTPGHTGSPQTVPMEDPSQAPEPINGSVKWYSVGLAQAVADNTANVVQPISYQDNEISTDDGQWSVQVGGASNRGTAWYKIAVGNAESLGATARQYTEDDCPISDLVMRIVVKGDYATSPYSDPSGLLSWASTMINVPFCDGARPNQVLNFIAVDCAKTALSSWYRLGHTPYQAGYNADKLVELAQAGTYTLVMPPTPIYPDTDTTPGHIHWTDMATPQPGDLVIFDWPTMHGPQFDHTTIFVRAVSGSHFAANGADETIYASSNQSFKFEVQDKDYSVLYGLVQSFPTRTDNPAGLPVRIAIVRFK